METKLNHREEQIRCYLASTGDAETACQQIKMYWCHKNDTLTDIRFNILYSLHLVFEAAFGRENKALYYNDFLADFCKDNNIW